MKIEKFKVKGGGNFDFCTLQFSFCNALK